MIRVDLFHPWKASIYGTATLREVIYVCSAAALFCLGLVIMAYGVVRVLEAIK